MTEQSIATVHRLSDFRRRSNLVCFSRQEFTLLLSVYSRRVISGEWKAYAIDHRHNMAQFSIFTNAHAQPVYSIVKFATSSRRKRQYAVNKGPTKVAEADVLAQALAYFGRGLRLVST
jgi:hypothetical protein